MHWLALQQGALTFPQIDPVLFQIGPVAIRWYALAYIVGIVIGWWYARRLVDNARPWGGPAPFSKIDLDDFVTWAVVGIIVGGRLGFVLFYAPGFYLQNPMAALAVWQGGMSFHGGLIGVSLAMVLFCRARAIALWPFVDVIAAVAPFGLLFGRIANFINAELWGRVTDVPWAVVFPNAGPLPRHPSQLYEAFLEGLVLLIVLRLATHRFAALQAPRTVTGLFLAGYAASRIVVEFFREPDAQLGFLLGTGWLTMGMVLSLPLLIGGIALMASARRTPSPQEPA